MTTKKSLLSINDIVEELGLSRVYIHRSITKFKTLKAHKEKIGNTKTERWVVSRENLEAWNNVRSLRNRRSDGRTKFTLYATQEEIKSLRAQLEVDDTGVEIEKAYKKKVVENS